MEVFASQTMLLVAVAGCMLFTALAVRSAGADRRRAVGRMSAIAAKATEERRSRLRSVSRRQSTASASEGLVQRIVDRLKLFSSKEAAAGRLLLARAGVRAEGALARYLFMRVSMPTVFGIAFLLDGHLLHVLPIPQHWAGLAACAATLAGFYAPVVMLKNKITKRQGDLKKSLPDGIDLLVICVESGASINEAFARVGRELVRGHAALAEEFSITAAELSFLPVRRTALENLLERTGLPGIRGIVTTMLQSERFGTPIAQSLRILSAEFRDARMMAAEEKAAKLPVLLTVPMMIFILPVLFIVLLGPAALTILDAMAK